MHARNVSTQEVINYQFQIPIPLSHVTPLKLNKVWVSEGIVSRI
jgi:hypothetical protein